MIRNFYLKKGCEGACGFLRIFWWHCEQNDGGNGGMDVLAEEFEEVKRSVRRKMKKKKKKEKRSEEKWGAGQRYKEMNENEWWGKVLGGEHMGTLKNLISFSFLFCLIDLDVMVWY